MGWEDLGIFFFFNPEFDIEETVSPLPFIGVGLI
jgi:hypothetical protein